MKTDESKFHFILKDYSLYYEKFQDGTVKSIQDEIPFEVPEGWEWVRLSNVLKIIFGQSPKSDKVFDKYNKNTIEFHQGKSNFQNKIIGISNKYADISSKIAEENSIVMSVRAPVGDINFTDRKITIGRGLCALKPISLKTDIDYIYSFLSTQKSFLESKATGTTFKSINSDQINNILVPFPPLNEQIKISSNIDLIFEMINEISTLQNELFKLNNKVKQLALNLAMQGKLIPQDPNDEPASVLLEKIKEEKEKLIKEGKIKRNKKESAIIRRGESYYELLDGEEKDITDEIPYSIPSNWEWTKLNYIFEVTSSKRVFKHEWTTEGIPFYRAREIVKFNKNEKLIDPIFISNTTYLEKKRISGIPCINDLLITGVGTIGVPYIVTDDEPFYFKDGNIIWLKNIYNINPKFIFYLFDSIKFKHLLSIGSNKTTVDTLTITRANELYIPLPSLREQIRIVKKLEAIQNV
ncbi:restriction endonuclease subunit S [Macrococcoides caseolyticum]|uniref:restriction endonuclease subunit S n=1 Tax=Macrococcoides caseolyticum TaxID=69966 RepID=UPI000C3375B0|nr:restriction endonuclease subunit S [Macrococcus caseolyticus]PKF35232.1 hypothetical protein CW687_05290 [Macrococcus caseolyticus]